MIEVRFSLRNNTEEKDDVTSNQLGDSMREVQVQRGGDHDIQPSNISSPLARIHITPPEE